MMVIDGCGLRYIRRDAINRVPTNITLQPISNEK
jgi:hypothetical protein